MMSAITQLAPQRAARIATQLMELIELQKLLPGDKLPPERQLADLLEVSRPSLREALHILQAQGLVQIKHGQGTYVCLKGPSVAEGCCFLMFVDRQNTQITTDSACGCNLGCGMGAAKGNHERRGC